MEYETIAFLAEYESNFILTIAASRLSLKLPN